jgi:hypothetical protein
MPTSKPESIVTIDGTPHPCTSAEAHFSFLKSPATAALVVPTTISSLDHDQAVVWTLDGDVRFTGLVRDYDRDLEAITTVYANSPDTLLDEYENSDDPSGWGGLSIFDLTGSWTATGSDLIKAVLDIVGVSYSSGNIGDNGATLNYFGSIEPYTWSAGVDSYGIVTDAGETARDYINKICRVMAVADVGFYRFFCTTGGDVYSYLIGGRPRSSPDFTFTEGIDFLRGKATRRFLQANTVLVTGFNWGDGGPFGNGGPEQFRSSPGSPARTYRYNSPLIERSNDSDPGGGMSCETVANALLPDVFRDTVYLPATLFTSALLGPGQTILVQGTLGGEPGNMGVGEKLWLQDNTIRFDDQGVTQECIFLGGGVDDTTSTPPV